MTNSQTTSALPEGQELLNGLYTVQSYLQESMTKFIEFSKLEQQHRSNLQNMSGFIERKSMNTVQFDGLSFSQFTCLKVGIWCAILSAIFSILNLVFFFSALSSIHATNSNINAMNSYLGYFVFQASFSSWKLIISLVIFRRFTKSMKKKKFSRVGFMIAAIILALLILMSRPMLPTETGRSLATVTAIILYLAGITRAFLTSKSLFKQTVDLANQSIDAENKKRAAHNESLTEANNVLIAEKQQISTEINAINEEMVQCCPWYPPDYYSLDIVERFIAIIVNHKASTLKDMVNIYDEEVRWKKHFADHDETIEKMNQSLDNQQMMMNLQKVANVLLVGNLVANLATAANTLHIAANTAATAANTAATAANTANTASSAASIARDADAIARNSGAKSWWE